MPAIKLLFIPILAVALATASAASDDADRDGVVDRLDECPASETGAPVTMRGCAYDTDADGIPDYRDDCQHSSGATVDSYG
ncbi:MAG: thrombospondin type 3 repeat-containing protein, partial [Gammaproteobacteria bacterium]|nr:thrombospondin type 3 repeat-containing protein [Gammaproteobacteria bacterium]